MNACQQLRATPTGRLVICEAAPAVRHDGEWFCRPCLRDYKVFLAVFPPGFLSQCPEPEEIMKGSR